MQANPAILAALLVCLNTACERGPAPEPHQPIAESRDSLTGFFQTLPPTTGCASLPEFLFAESGGDGTGGRTLVHVNHDEISLRSFGGAPPCEERFIGRVKEGLLAPEEWADRCHINSEPNSGRWRALGTPGETLDCEAAIAYMLEPPPAKLAVILEDNADRLTLSRDETAYPIYYLHAGRLFNNLLLPVSATDYGRIEQEYSSWLGFTTAQADALPAARD
jgi:hypothetical protein